MKRILLFLSLAIASLVYPSDIAIITLAAGEGYRNTVEIGIENKRQYCAMHGYDFICCEDHLDPSRPIPWSKILLVQEAMKNPKYKWIFWSDADSLITNLSIRLEDFIDENYNLIIGRDLHDINTGQFFLKNCHWSHQLLSNIYAHTECINHGWWEQQALILELRQNPELLKLTKILPQRLFNSYFIRSLRL